MCHKAHTEGVDSSIATRVVSPVSKLVNPQHMQPVHLKGHGPIKKKARQYEEIRSGRRHDEGHHLKRQSTVSGTS